VCERRKRERESEEEREKEGKERNGRLVPQWGAGDSEYYYNASGGESREETTFRPLAKEARY
jgi:hypothetical protein